MTCVFVWHHQAAVLSLAIIITPQLPEVIPSTTPLGATVATVNVIRSDGRPFNYLGQGSLIFGPPNFNDGGLFALSGGPNNPFAVIINPSGPGVAADGSTTQHFSLAAADL